MPPVVEQRYLLSRHLDRVGRVEHAWKPVPGGVSGPGVGGLSRHSERIYVHQSCVLAAPFASRRSFASTHLRRVAVAAHRYCSTSGGDVPVCREHDARRAAGCRWSRHLRNGRNARDALGSLSDREREVLAVVAEGHSNAAVGRALRLSGLLRG